MKNMKNKGFTLVELLAVLSIIGVVAILVMPTMLEALRNGKTMLKKFDKQGVLDAGEMYMTDLDMGIKEYTYQGNETLKLINDHTYKKNDVFSPYDLKLYVIDHGGIDVNMRFLVKEGYYDKNCHYAGEELDGEILKKDKNCHVPADCTIHISIDYSINEEGYYVTEGYTSKFKSGCGE